jgi:N-acetylmuramoyl-L-alanine amidase
MLNIIRKPASHFHVGRLHGHKPVLIVIHIAEGTLAGTDEWFIDPRCDVSSHYQVGKNGEIHQYVNETDTAYHAGIVDRPSSILVKQLKGNPNNYSIGIEHEGKAGDAPTALQLAATTELVATIAKRWGITIDKDHVIPHHAIRFMKPCPGPGFNVNTIIATAKSLTI